MTSRNLLQQATPSHNEGVSQGGPVQGPGHGQGQQAIGLQGGMSNLLHGGGLIMGLAGSPLAHAPLAPMQPMQRMQQACNSPRPSLAGRVELGCTCVQSDLCSLASTLCRA